MHLSTSTISELEDENEYNTTNNTPNSKPNQYTEIYCWGDDKYGQLGIEQHQKPKQFKNRIINYPIPRYCKYNTAINQISCGDEHVSFIANGYIYTMGNNMDGQLGIAKKNIKYSSIPCLVQNLIRFKAIKIGCGAKYTAVIIESGKVYTWGNNEDGQLGIGNLVSQYTPQCIPFFQDEFITASDIGCGSNHVAIIASTGEVYTWGSNDQGQLGTGKSINENYPNKIKISNEPIQQVSCSANHTLFLTESGKIYGCGSNLFGQLAFNDKKNFYSPSKINGFDQINIAKIYAGYHSACISTKGDLYIWGITAIGDFKIPQIIQNNINNQQAIFTDVQMGNNFTILLDSRGIVWAFGQNTSGELGMGDYEPRNIITRVNIQKGIKLNSIACGKNFVIGCGDIVDNPNTAQFFGSYDLNLIKNDDEFNETEKKNITFNEMEELGHITSSSEGLENHYNQEKMTFLNRKSSKTNDEGWLADSNTAQKIKKLRESVSVDSLQKTKKRRIKNVDMKTDPCREIGHLIGNDELDASLQYHPNTWSFINQQEEDEDEEYMRIYKENKKNRKNKKKRLRKNSNKLLPSSNKPKYYDPLNYKRNTTDGYINKARNNNDIFYNDDEKEYNIDNGDLLMMDDNNNEEDYYYYDEDDGEDQEFIQMINNKNRLYTMGDLRNILADMKILKIQNHLLIKQLQEKSKQILKLETKMKDMKEIIQKQKNYNTMIINNSNNSNSNNNNSNNTSNSNINVNNHNNTIITSNTNNENINLLTLMGSINNIKDKDKEKDKELESDKDKKLQDLDNQLKRLKEEYNQQKLYIMNKDYAITDKNKQIDIFIKEIENYKNILNNTQNEKNNLKELCKIYQCLKNIDGDYIKELQRTILILKNSNNNPGGIGMGNQNTNTLINGSGINTISDDINIDLSKIEHRRYYEEQIKNISEILGIELITSEHSPIPTQTSSDFLNDKRTTHETNTRTSLLTEKISSIPPNESTPAPCSSLEEDSRMITFTSPPNTNIQKRVSNFNSESTESKLVKIENSLPKKKDYSNLLSNYIRRDIPNTLASTNKPELKSFKQITTMKYSPQASLGKNFLILPESFYSTKSTLTTIDHNNNCNITNTVTTPNPNIARYQKLNSDNTPKNLVLSPTNTTNDLKKLSQPFLLNNLTIANNNNDSNNNLLTEIDPKLAKRSIENFLLKKKANQMINKKHHASRHAYSNSLTTAITTNLKPNQLIKPKLDIKKKEFELSPRIENNINVHQIAFQVNKVESHALYNKLLNTNEQQQQLIKCNNTGIDTNFKKDLQENQEIAIYVKDNIMIDKLTIGLIKDD